MSALTNIYYAVYNRMLNKATAAAQRAARATRRATEKDTMEAHVAARMNNDNKRPPRITGR